MKNDYITKDIGEAASLVSRGCRMRDVQWKDNTAYFLFSDESQCRDLSRQYFFEGLTVPARLYYDNLRMIKRQLYAGEKGGKHVSRS